MAFDQFENLYIADRAGCVIRKVTTTGEITIYAGKAVPGKSCQERKREACGLSANPACLGDGMQATEAILDDLIRYNGCTAKYSFDHPQKVKDYVALHLGSRGQEVFAVLFLDGQHRLLALEEMFHGTLAQTSVYPREVVRRALQLNAGALILAHNHPSGLAEPSRADEYLTQTLKSALQLVDVRVLDHLIVGRGTVLSFAERGLL